MLKNIQKSLITIILVSQLGHIFCCVLPTVFSILSLLAGLGILYILPAGLENLHDMIHDYENYIMIASAILLVFGWAIYMISLKINCNEVDIKQACSHEPCEPKKDRAKIILLIASALFLINVSVYLGFHDAAPLEAVIHSEEHTHDHEHAHDH